MTAALTVLEFSENSSLNVEFYSETDFKFIKKQADKYEKELKNKTEEIFKRLEKESTKVLNEKEQSQMREKARNQALDEFKRDDKFNKMHTCYEQNKLIEKSALNLSELEKHKEFQGSLSEIQTKLKDYVGSSGKFMPFTKSITLRLDNEFLKDVQIIDTPGLNDPVLSRSERTNEFLDKCDVVLLLSFNGQFMDNSNENLIARLAGTKDTARIFCIASKADEFGLENKGKDLNTVLQETIQLRKEQRDEIKDKDLGRLPNGVLKRVLDEKIILNSSHCASILAKNGQNLDKDESHTFNRLKKTFADDFKDEESQTQSLKKLANIDTLKGIFSELKEKKDEFFQSQVAGFLNKRLANFNEYKKGLYKIINTRIEILKNNDMKMLEKKAECLKKKERGEILLDTKWNKLCQEFCLNLSQGLKEKHDEFFEDLENKAEFEKGYFIETTGLIFKDIHRLEKINASAVRKAFFKTNNKLENLLNDESKRKILSFRDKIEEEMGMGSGLSKEISGELLDDTIFNKCLMDIFDKKIKSLPQFYYELPPFISSANGLIKDTHDGWIFHDYTREASDFIEKLTEFSQDFRKKVKNDIKKLIEELEKVLEFDFGQQMFKGLADEIESLQKDLQDKDEKLCKLDKLKSEIESV